MEGLSHSERSWSGGGSDRGFVLSEPNKASLEGEGTGLTLSGALHKNGWNMTGRDT